MSHLYEFGQSFLHYSRQKKHESSLATENSGFHSLIVETTANIGYPNLAQLPFFFMNKDEYVKE